MITNLFSIFDPASSIFNFSLNWISALIGIILIPTYFWLIPTRHFYLWNNIINILHNEFKILIGNTGFNGSTFIFINLFSIILFNNFLGLFPYIFTSSSHLTFTLTLRLPLWLRFITYGWINNTKHILYHLVPQGTPGILIPFIVCIETIRNIIRPGTLAVRLTANIIAGHLLITLLGNTGTSIITIIIRILIVVQCLLLLLERAVSIIQSYVFAVLSTLYSREIN